MPVPIMAAFSVRLIAELAGSNVTGGIMLVCRLLNQMELPFMQEFTEACIHPAIIAIAGNRQVMIY